MADVLRAIPVDPAAGAWVCQNATRLTEYDVNVERWTCSCEGFAQRRDCKHLKKCCAAAAPAERETMSRTYALRQEIRAALGELPAAAEFDQFMARALAAPRRKAA